MTHCDLLVQAGAAVFLPGFCSFGCFANGLLLLQRVQSIPLSLRLLLVVEETVPGSSQLLHAIAQLIQLVINFDLSVRGGCSSGGSLCSKAASDEHLAIVHLQLLMLKKSCGHSKTKLTESEPLQAESADPE